MPRRKLDTADRSLRASLARAAAELGSAGEDVDRHAAELRAASRAAASARRDYAAAWSEFAEIVRSAYDQGVSVAELSRLTGFRVGFLRPVALGQVRSPRPNGRRARQAESDL